MCVHDVHIFLNNTRHRVVCCDTPNVPATIATHSLFYRALLQKRPIILRSLPLSPSVCTSSISFWTTCKSFCEIENALTGRNTIRSHLLKLHLHLQHTYTFDTCVHVMHVVLWNRICFHRSWYNTVPPFDTAPSPAANLHFPHTFARHPHFYVG